MEQTEKNLEMGTGKAKSIQEYPLSMLGFGLVCLLPLAIAWEAVRDLVVLAVDNDTYSHIPLIPLVSIFLIYTERKFIFSRISRSWGKGVALLLPGMLALVLAQLNVGRFDSANQLSLLMFGVVLVWMGAFLAFFGVAAFSAALFPLLFLLFAVPIPEWVLSRTIAFLQRESANAASAMFNLVGVPVLRQDLIFSLPGISIRVAEECSGIRSTLALLITTVLAAHFFLKSTLRSLLLCILIVPIAIIKNGMRIATLTCLAVYVDPGFLHGNLHRYGGIPFFFLDLLMLGLALVLLRRGQDGPSQRTEQKQSFQ